MILSVQLNPFQSSVVFHIETSSLICSAIEMNGFYLICNIGLPKWSPDLPKAYLQKEEFFKKH